MPSAANQRMSLLGHVLSPQLRVGGHETSHHVHAPLIFQDHYLNPARPQKLEFAVERPCFPTTTRGILN